MVGIQLNPDTQACPKLTKKNPSHTTHGSKCKVRGKTKRIQSRSVALFYNLALRLVISELTSTKLVAIGSPLSQCGSKPTEFLGSGDIGFSEYGSRLRGPVGIYNCSKMYSAVLLRSTTNFKKAS